MRRRLVLAGVAVAACLAAGVGVYWWVTRPVDRLTVTADAVVFEPVPRLDRRVRVVCIDARSRKMIAGPSYPAIGTIELRSEPGWVVLGGSASSTFKVPIAGEWQFIRAYHGFAPDGRECLTVFLGTPGTGADWTDG